VLRASRLAVVGVVLAWAMTATVAVAGPGRACACGAFVTPGGQRATMNHEVALVHWQGQTETVLMQLALKASADNVALVVPTPAPAAVASGDKATFVELDRLSAPEMRERTHWRLGMASLDRATSKAGAPLGTPSVLSRVQLGPLEATTLAGGDLPGLQKWFGDNGYAIRPAVSDALGPYVRDGWAFVAIRLTSTTPIVGGLDPVRLTFPSSRLVYPMRVSVAAPGPQNVTVFALSDHRQQRIDPDAARQRTEIQFAGDISGAVQDPELRALASDHGGYLTKIAVNIAQPSEITSDFAFTNAPTDDAYRQVVYVDRDRVIPIELIVFAVSVLAVLAAVVFLVLRSRRRRITPSR
jgi:hypothetical protein